MAIDALEMHVAVVTHDPNVNKPVLILKNEDAGKILPIWIGPYEAYAIMMAIEGVEPARPLTHDLIKNVLDALDATVDRIIVNDLADNTFYARIILHTREGTMEIDSRPSDAIAVALRTNAPIFVSNSVIRSSGADTEGGKDVQDRLERLLEDLTPQDFDFDKPS